LPEGLSQKVAIYRLLSLLHMNEVEFKTQIEAFVKKYECDNWELRKSESSIYAVNQRRPLAVELQGLRVFVTYYISFDQVFRVPVLSAVFFTETGHQLTLDEFHVIVPIPLDRASVSEGEHQILQIPVLFIHPCNTDAFIHPFIHNGAEYLHVWMNSYGPVFLYRLPF
jgi:hypothetical protein